MKTCSVFSQKYQEDFLWNPFVPTQEGPKHTTLSGLSEKSYQALSQPCFPSYPTDSPGMCVGVLGCDPQQMDPETHNIVGRGPQKHWYESAEIRQEREAADAVIG